MKKIQNRLAPLVSIIMNCYNGQKYLREAVQSVINQTYQNWEIFFGIINLKTKAVRY